jgi:hypothetical protein
MHSLRRVLVHCLQLCFACFVAGVLTTATVAQTKIQARRADDFVDSMGINLHMEATSSPYNRYKLTNQKLRELGMRHFRDEINDTDRAFVDEMQRIGKLGYTLCGLIEGGNDYPRHGTRLQADAVVPMITNLLPTIDAVEGPNEPDSLQFKYDGTKFPHGAINESEDLWKIVQEHSEISMLPVLAMSEGYAPDFQLLAAITPPPIDYATYGNMHAYQGGLTGDYGLGGYYIPYARLLTGRDPLWTTEMGYHNNTQYLSDGEQQGVSERASAIYLPIAFLSGFIHRVQRTFSYELIDEFSDPGLTSGSGEGHYGLLRFDGTPKPAFLAIKNLIALLRDPGSQDFRPGSLAVTFNGAPDTMRYTLLQKSSGDDYLAVWNDVGVYQTATAGQLGKDVYPEGVPIGVTFSDATPTAVYAPNDESGIGETEAYTISSDSRSVTLKLPPQVLLIKIEAR